MQPCLTCGITHQGPCPYGRNAQTAQDEMEPILLTSGEVLQGRYEILHVLGQGGMGTVFMASDLKLQGRNCVIKKLRDDFYREEDRQKAQAFFQREIAVLSTLEHRNIVGIKDYFTEGDDFFLVMEYVQGNNLHYMLHEDRRGEPFPEKTVMSWVKQICDVLQYLHGHMPPVIYRDLKPSNIMIDFNDTVKLVDFGIARPFEEGSEHTHVISAGYSPPEQYWGAADPRSDIYSLGATMHFLLTGKEPEALHCSSPKMFNADVSDVVDQLVQTATAQDIGERYQTVEDFLEAAEREPEPRHKRFGEALTYVAVIALAVGIYFALGALHIGEGMPPTNHTLSDPEGSMPTDTNSSTTGSNTENHHGGIVAVPLGRSLPPLSSSANRSDLAVQIMDEEDVSDEERGTMPKAEKPPDTKSHVGFAYPWLQKKN